VARQMIQPSSTEMLTALSQLRLNSVCIRKASSNGILGLVDMTDRPRPSALTLLELDGGEPWEDGGSAGDEEEEEE